MNSSIETKGLASKYFPLNYSDSRIRFSKYLKPFPEFRTENWNVPSRIDSDLFVDVAYSPAKKSEKFLIFISSGIHGSETYAGSAIQQMFLNEIYPQMDRSETGVLLVHAMNPYGFKNHQRTTENGVNLNRNFSVSGSLFRTENLDSRKIHEKFFAYEPVRSLKSKLFESLQMNDGKAFFDEVPLDHFVKAVSPGQFERPDHLEFGGKNLEPQSEKLARKVEELMRRYQDVLAIDLHTGLGHANRLHLLTSGSGLDLHPELFAQLFHPKEDHVFYEHTPASEEGFYEVHGALNSLFADLASKENRVCAITAEFGTLGHDLESQLKGCNSFILTHQGQYYGYQNRELEALAKRENFERSYPQSDVWKESVINSARGLFQNVLSRR